MFKKYFIYLNFKKKLKNYTNILVNRFKTPFYIYMYVFSMRLVFNKIFYKFNYNNVNFFLKINQLHIYTNYFSFLVSLNFNDFYFFLNTLLLLFGLWLFFFKLNSNLIKITPQNSTNTNPIKTNSNNTFLSFYYYLVFYKLFDIYFVHGKNSLI